MRHEETLERVLERPAPADLEWEHVESALRSVGVQVKERPGARVALVAEGHVMVVRRPHPMPLAVRATVADVASFLKTIGVKP